MSKSKSIRVDLSEDLRQIVAARCKHAGFVDAGEYLRSLVRADWQREQDSQLAQLALDALKSGKRMPVNAKFWRDLETDVAADARKTAPRRRKAG